MMFAREAVFRKICNVELFQGILKSGNNFYEFSGFDQEDKKIVITDEFTIKYEKPAVNITETLSAPKVLSLNGAAIINNAGEVQVGIIMALAGGPLFVAIVRTMRLA